MTKAKKISDTFGIDNGGLYEFSDGTRWFVKNPEGGIKQAKHEALAFHLAKLAGVPVPEIRLTQLNGKTAIASKAVEGKQISEFAPQDYFYIKGMYETYPFHAWINNRDAVGAGTYNPLGNVIVGPDNKATFIDLGGSFDIGGLGKKKSFGPKVDELDSLMESNKSIQKVFASGYPQITHGKDNPVAKRIANISDGQIADLVNQYGPANIAERTELYNKLVSRRDDLAQKYGIWAESKPIPDEFVKEAQTFPGLPAKGQTLEDLEKYADDFLAKYDKQPHTEPSDIAYGDPSKWPPPDLETQKKISRLNEEMDVPGEKYSFKNVEKDSNLLLENHLYGGEENLHNPSAYDLEGMAKDIYNMAKVNPDHADKIFQNPKFPAELVGPLNDHIKQLMKSYGDPWAGPPIAKAPVSLMKLNKTHGIDTVVNTLKDYPPTNELLPGKIVTQKQKDNLAAKFSNTPNASIAKAMEGLNKDQTDTILSWMNPHQKQGVNSYLKKALEIPEIGKLTENHSLHQIVQAVKNYTPQYAEVPHHIYNNVPQWLSKYTPEELIKATEKLNLSQKGKMMQWIPMDVQDKMAEIGAAKNIKKIGGFIPQEYYDALTDVKGGWQNYKRQGTTSSRQQLTARGGESLLDHILSLGFNPDVTLYKGGKYQNYPKSGTILDPVTEPHRLTNPSERAFFLTHDREGVAEAYGQVGKPYIARPSKVLEVHDYYEVTGTHDYASHHMRNFIEAAREQGADLLVVHNVVDVASMGHTPQTQYAFLNTHVLRGPLDAEFNPNKLQLRNPLAGLVGGGLFTYGMLRGQEKDESKMARGGRMPLIKSGSKAAVSSNIREMVRAGHPQKQAIAAALSTARRYGRASGGASGISNMAMRGSSIKLGREGMINSPIPGRTDKLPMKVQAGSYILPADIPSALGQGNTMAGGEVLKKMFSAGPYGLTPLKGGRGGTSGRKLKGFQEGGGIQPEDGEIGDDRVPIIAAGGEYIIHPNVVQAVGHGDLTKGHEVLDKFVVHTRKKHIETLKKLPGPKK
jgi:hypothetical protein